MAAGKRVVGTVRFLGIIQLLRNYPLTLHHGVGQGRHDTTLFVGRLGYLDPPSLATFIAR